MSDAYRTFLLNNGGTSGAINDLEDQVLVSLGFSVSEYGTNTDRWMAWLAGEGYISGSLNDRWYAYLVDNGYTGALPDMLYAFWLEGVLAADDLLESILTSELGGDGMNINWLADHVEIVDSVGSLSYSGPILDKVTYTGTKKMVVGPNGLLRWTAHNDYDTPAAPANQAITVVSGATYTIAVTGTTSITLSGAATGTVTAGNPISFTAATGTLTCGSTSGTGTAHLRRTPSDSTYVEDYGLPTEYDINTLDGSTTDTAIASSGKITLTLTGSTDYRNTTTAWADSTSYSIGDMVLGVNGESFTCTVAHTSDDDQPSGEGDTQWKRDDLFVRVSATDDVDGAWMLGRVKSQSGTTLTLEVLKSVGSGSYDDWHVIAVKGVADEPVVQNINTYSTPDNTNWATGAATITSASDLVGLPAGTITSASATHFKGVAFIAANNSDPYAAYLFLKSDSLTTAAVRMGNGGNYVECVFDLSAGTAGTPTTGGTGANASAEIEDYGGGVYRCLITADTIGDGATISAIVYPGTSTTGTGSVIAAAMDVVQGTTWSSHIPTSGAAVERAKDNYSIEGSEVPLNALAGFMYEDFDLANVGLSDTSYMLTLDDGTTTNAIFLWKDTTDDLNASVSGGLASLTLDSSVSAGSHRMALSWEPDNVVGSADGEAVVTDSDTSGGIPPVDTIIFGDRSSGARDFVGHHKQSIVGAITQTAAEIRAKAA